MSFLAGCISRYSAGSIYHYPSYHHQHNPAQVECFQKDLKRYLNRKIGFEAVMRIRCSKGAIAQQLCFSQAHHWMSMTPLKNLGGNSCCIFKVDQFTLFFCRSFHPHVPWKLLCAFHRPLVPSQCEPRCRFCCSNVN